MVQHNGVIMKYLLLVPVLFLANCSSLDVVSDAVQKYCDLPETQRLANREAVATSVAPNRIEITCEQETDQEGS